MKRSVTRARGRGMRIEKPFSQITIVVRTAAEAEAA
jgi:ribosomal protein L22